LPVNTDKGENSEGEKHGVKLVIPGKHPPEALETPEKPLDSVALFIQFFAICPRL
jgi:hypothetical protein